MIDDVGQLFFLIFNRVAQTVHLDLERWGCFAFFLLLAFDRLVFLALKTFLTLVEIFKSAVNRKDLIHKIGSINNQLSRLLCYTLNSLVDVPILQQHFLVVRFDLLVVPISDEFCHMDLAEASYLCNKEIVSRCQQLICFAFHDSRTLLQTCSDAEEQRKVVTLFYFD